MPVASPCTQHCQLDTGLGLCTGCGRTMAEIEHWQDMDDPRRHVVVAAAAARLPLTAKRGENLPAV